MKNAILIHGRPDEEEFYDPSFPSPSNDHWFPWLSKKLQLKDIHPVAIEVPKPYQPRYSVWKKEFERFETGPDTILVGHSTGAGFLLRYLSENDIQVGTVVLVAPFIDPDNDPANDTADFFDFEIDENMADKTNKLIVFESTNDLQSVQKTIAIIKPKLKNAEFITFENYGHFCKEDMLTTEFPELLSACLQ